MTSWIFLLLIARKHPILRARDYTYGLGVFSFAKRLEQRAKIDDNNLLAGIQLFPNPLNGNTFYIKAPRLNGEQLNVTINDLSGRRIFEQTLECQSNTVTISMGDNLSSGVYMVTLKHGGESHTYRLIKE